MLKKIKDDFKHFLFPKIFIFILISSIFFNEYFIFRKFYKSNKIPTNDINNLDFVQFFKNKKYSYLTNGRITVFANCDNIYCKYIPIFCASLLYSDKRNRTDIEIVTALTELPENITKAIIYLKKTFTSSKIIIRNNIYKVKNNYAILNNKIIKKDSVRFLVEPTIKNEYIFIGDIDIIYLVDNYYDNYLMDMFNRTSCYSNIVRENTSRLSGVHFSKWFCFYPIILNKKINLKMHNENLLLIRLKELGINIDYQTKYRPIFGIHMSVNRNLVFDKKINLSWGAEGKKILWKKFKENKTFKYIYSLLDIYILNKIIKLEKYYEKNE